MRISDWSSDVCSSDLEGLGLLGLGGIAMYERREQLGMGAQMTVEIHAHEGRQLHEARIDLAPHAGETRRDSVDHLRLEPLHRMADGEDRKSTRLNSSH